MITLTLTFKTQEETDHVYGNLRGPEDARTVSCQPFGEDWEHCQRRAARRADRSRQAEKAREQAMSPKEPVKRQIPPPTDSPPGPVERGDHGSEWPTYVLLGLLVCSPLFGWLAWLAIRP
jgi:hypothetical protein